MENTYKNCFANLGKKGCKALTEKLCETKGRCPFYKSQKQFDEEEKKYGGIIK